MRGNTGAGVWAGPAYRSEEMEAKLRDQKLKSQIHRKGRRGKPMTERAKDSNRTKSSVRAKTRIGMKDLACNMRHLGQLRRLTPCTV